MSNYTCSASPPATTQPGSDALAPEPVSSTVGASTGSPKAALSDSDALATGLSGWTPRLGSSHLSRGANGIWYMRLVVPEHIRARHPELPRELRRSTKVALKSLALAKSREMCLDFFVKYGSGAPMLKLDEKPDESFALFYENGKIRIDHSPSASVETIILMQRCFDRMIEQIVGRVQRSPVHPPMSEATAAAISVVPMTIQPVASPIPAVAADATPQEVIPPEKRRWLSDAIEDWRINGGTKFSDHSWRFSYEASFRVFREIVGDTRRDFTHKDGTIQPGMLDIEMHRLTRSHIEAYFQGLRRLPPNQGSNTKNTEAHERIRQGIETKAKWPSLTSVEKKLVHVAPFITYASLKEWIKPEVLSEMKLSVQAASANLIKAEKQSPKKKGAVALSDAELKSMFEQPAFLNGAMFAPWCYWVPQICLYQGARVSESSGLHTDDIITIGGVPCMSFISDDANDEDEPDGQAPKKARGQKVLPRTSEEYRRVKNKASRRVVPIHPKLIERGFMDFVELVRSYSRWSGPLFLGLRWDDKMMFGRKPARFMKALIQQAGFYELRRKVPHSLRSNFHQCLKNTMLDSNLQKQLLGHSTGDMKDSNYNETDQGPAFPFAEVLPYLEKMDFGIDIPNWAEVKRLGAIARADGSLKRPVSSA